MAALGVQNSAYNSAIETLAGILEQRDRTFKEFKGSGGKSVIEYTNKGGSTNMTKNPLLVLWDDLNKSALAYWRELGLTPSSYKKMTGDTVKKEKAGGLAAALASVKILIKREKLACCAKSTPKSIRDGKENRMY